MVQHSLFASDAESKIQLAAGAYYLPGYCLASADQLWQLASQHLANHPASRMMTPMGYPMSVQTSSMGKLGWVSDTNGYDWVNPTTKQPWPLMPAEFADLANRAAKAAGYTDFIPDTCLINLYQPGAKMGLHQDKDEKDFNHPIVSVSLGIEATFLFGGVKRNDPVKKCLLQHGDVVVFGGESRRYYHGVARVKEATHTVLGAFRCNLTFRKAGVDYAAC